jgi:hypothetical protein
MSEKMNVPADLIVVGVRIEPKGEQVNMRRMRRRSGNACWRRAFSVAAPTERAAKVETNAACLSLFGIQRRC